MFYRLEIDGIGIYRYSFSAISDIEKAIDKLMLMRVAHPGDELGDYPNLRGHCYFKKELFDRLREHVQILASICDMHGLYLDLIQVHEERYVKCYEDDKQVILLDNIRVIGEQENKYKQEIRYKLTREELELLMND